MTKHAGFSRFVYNFGLSLRTGLYGVVKTSDSKVIDNAKKLLTNDLKKRPEYAWMNELSSRVYQNAFKDLKKAFSNYRSGRTEHPTLAKRKDGETFTVDDGNGRRLVKAGNRITIPTLGTFRLHEPLNETYVSQTFHLVKEGGRWFVSFTVDAEKLPIDQPQGSVGIDLGVKAFATLSNGEVFEAPKPLKQAKTKLAQLQRKASKQVKGSKNQRKTYSKINRLYFQISNIRKNWLNKLTTYLTKTFKVIKIEDLNVKGMLANHKLAAAIADLGFYEFRRQLTYKCGWYGSLLVVIDRWFPSSKTCSDCGFIQPMSLKERVFSCGGCGSVKDRDYNASQNNLNYEPSA